MAYIECFDLYNIIIMGYRAVRSRQLQTSAGKEEVSKATAVNFMASLN